MIFRMMVIHGEAQDSLYKGRMINTWLRVDLVNTKVVILILIILLPVLKYSYDWLVFSGCAVTTFC
jgi:hypothetical protein